MNNPIRSALVNPGVYPPSEDTYALFDAIEPEKDDIMLDMGCGSGYISINFAERVKTLYSVDVQYPAVRNTRENLLRYGLLSRSHVIQSDLFGAISPKCKFDLITFNPPYLPEDDDHTIHDIALIGGATGIEVSERFIEQCVNHLSPRGRVYLVASSLSDLERLKEVMQSHGLHTSIAHEEPLFFETLVILKGENEK